MWRGGQTNCQLLPRRQGLQGNGNESLRRHLPCRETVDREAISEISGSCACGVRERSDRSVEMLPVRTEREPDEIALVCHVAESRIGKLGDLIGVEIQDGGRLLRARLLRA